MEYQSTLISSLLLCGLVAAYLFLQYRSKHQHQTCSRGGIQPGLKIAASLQPSPGVKVHLLRWTSSDEMRQGEFLLVTTAQTIQITQCHTQLTDQTQSALQAATNIHQNEIPHIRRCATHH